MKIDYFFKSWYFRFVPEYKITSNALSHLTQCVSQKHTRLVSKNSKNHNTYNRI